MPVTCIIPARGGSKGIELKNLVLVNGVSLIRRAVQSAKLAGCHVIVSTDHPEIEKEALAAGARVYLRSAELSGDEVTSEAVLLDVLEQAGIHEGVFVFAQCTCPLTIADDITRCIAWVNEHPKDVAVTAVPFHAPIWQLINDKYYCATHDTTQARQSRQSVNQLWRETGGVYAMRAERFIEQRNRFCGNVVPIFIDPARGIDIDNDEDAFVADQMARWFTFKGRRLDLIDTIVLDFDGVMTDNAVWTNENGSESVRCDKADGVGIRMAQDAGIFVYVLTRETNASVAARCHKLNVKHVVASNKHWAIESIVRDLRTAIYVGNDADDIECMRACRLSACPSDAHPSVLDEATIILHRPGGHGAIRELVDMMLEGRHV